MYLTKSSAQVNSSDDASHLSCPAGGSPRSARMLVMPAALHVAKASSIFCLSTLVHVRCMLGTVPACFVRLHSSIVKSDVEPPAPHVTSAKTGAKRCSLVRALKRFSTPASVLGGKNSTLSHGLPRGRRRRAG